VIVIAYDVQDTESLSEASLSKELDENDTSDEKNSRTGDNVSAIEAFDSARDRLVRRSSLTSPFDSSCCSSSELVRFGCDSSSSLSKSCLDARSRVSTASMSLMSVGQVLDVHCRGILGTFPAML